MGWANEKGSTLRAKLNKIGLYFLFSLGLTECLVLALAQAKWLLISRPSLGA